MTEFYNEHDCDCHIHPHKDPIEDFRMFVANYYTSLLTKLRNHINDSNAGHITAEEKDYWNNKADKIALRDLEEMFVNLKNKVNNIEDTILSNLKQWIKNKKYVTEDDMISYVTNQINKIVAGDINLTGYAKESWVLEQIRKMTNPGGELDLSKYALKTDLNALIARIASLEVKVDNIENKIDNIENSGGGKNYEITNVTVTGQTLTITQNNMGSKSVTLPSGGGSTTSGVTESEVQSMLSNAKTLIVTKNGESFKSYNPFNSPNDITIDLVTNGGGSGGDDSNKYYQAFFQNKNSNTVAPAIPETGKGPNEYQSTDERSKWVTNATNPNKGYYTWMTFAFVSNGVYGSWTNPVCITGKDGEAGTDITGKEQIYKTAGEGETVSKPDNNPDINDYVPSGWTDNPQGVSATVPCEWTCVRIKNTETNKWGDWTEPVLWAHYGHNGTDGDGVEYIFWAGSSEQAYPASEPNSWYTDEQSKNNEYDSNGQYSEEDNSDEYYNSKYYNKREFIKANTGWQDNPIDLSASNYGPGSKQYVSIRKKRNDSNEQSSEAKDAYWHQYSEPALWSYYAQDGDAGKGVSLNLDNGTMAVSLNSDGKNQTFDQTCTARFYNGTSTISISSITCEIFDASGNKVETDNGLTIDATPNSVDPNCKDIKVHIDNNKLSFNNGGYTIKIAAKASVTGEETTRYATIQLIGVNFGEDGVSYRLNLSSTVVKVSRGDRYPSTIDVKLCKTRGADSIQLIPVSQIITTDSRWQFKYSIDNKQEEVLSVDTIDSSLISRAENTIRVELDFNNMLVDTETIVIVKDGINGISYSIDTKSDNVIGKYSGDDISYSGKVEFYVTKIISNVSSEYLDINDVEVKAYLGGAVSNETAVQYDQSSNLWSVNVNNTPSAFVLISVTEKSTGMFYTSSVIPFITPGKDGEAAAPQTLKGSPLRMRGTWVSGTEYFDGTVATTDGIMYQDVVIYNNIYYVCVNHEGLNSGNWLLTPSSTDYWQKMSVTEDFVVNRLAANQAYIKEFSSEEVVIMDNKTIVAGMTSSKSLENSLLPSNVTKNDIRIWAGQFNGGNLKTAPFTVSSTGVVTSGSDNKIILNDGTIYFVVDGKIWHLGITNGKPDWISSEHPITNAYFYNVTNRNGKNVLSSTQMIYDNTDEVYYSDYASKRLASGTYLEIMINGDVDDYGVLCETTLGQFVADAHLYQSCTFNNGVKTSNDEYFIIGDSWEDNGSRIIYNRSVQVYYGVGSSGNYPAAATIIDNDGNTKWPSCDFAPGSDTIHWANKKISKVSYKSSSTMPSVIGLDTDGGTQIVVTTFLSSNTSSSKKHDFIGFYNLDE